MADDPPTGKNGAGIVLIDAEGEGSGGNETSPLLGSNGDGPESTDNGTTKDTWPGALDFAHLPWYRRPSVNWLVGPYALFTLAFGGVIVPKLNLIVDLVCQDYFAERSLADPTFTFIPVVFGQDNPQCLAPDVQKSVATFTLVIGAMTGALCALTVPQIGSLSDRYGRTKLMAVASVGGILAEIITILAAKYPLTVNYRWMILGAFFDGLSGSLNAGSILGHSYAADCTPPSKRAVSIGYLHACLFTGLAFGPLLAGYFIKWTGSLLSIFYVVLGCHLFFIMYILFILPESLSKAKQMQARSKYHHEHEALVEEYRNRLPGATWRFVGPNVSEFLDSHFSYLMPMLISANPLRPLKNLVPPGAGLGRLRRNLVLLAFLDIIIMMSMMGSGTIIILYSEWMFDWGNFEASRFVSIVSLVRVVVLLGLFPIVNYFFRLRPLQRRRRESGVVAVKEENNGSDRLDLWLLRIALSSDLLGIIGYIFVRRAELFILCGMVTAVGGLGGAIIQSSFTKHVPAERVGSILGAVGLLTALGKVVAPILFNGLYALTVDKYPQAFFVLLAGLFGMAILASLFIRPHVFLKEETGATYESRTSEDEQALLADDERPPELPAI